MTKDMLLAIGDQYEAQIATDRDGRRGLAGQTTMDFDRFVFYALPPSWCTPRPRVITVRNPVHAALYLVLAFFTSAGLWLLLEAEFLAIALVLVYVGAVMVLFLFVVMMLDINVAPLREGFIRYLPVGLTVALLIVLEMGLVVGVKNFGLAGGGHPGAARGGLQQHPGTGRRALHRLRLSLRDRRGDPAGGHHRRHRAHHAPPPGDQVPEPGHAGRA